MPNQMPKNTLPTDSIVIKWGRLQVGITGRLALTAASVTIIFYCLSEVVRLW
jgi:hypothetical protein